VEVAEARAGVSEIFLEEAGLPTLLPAVWVKDVSTVAVSAPRGYARLVSF
jgi:hypothetical protein